MSVNHEYEVVEKEVVFSEGLPVTPYKLFDVTGDVLAFIVPSVKNPLNADAILAIAEESNSTLWSIETAKAEIPSRNHKVVSSDLYMSVITDSPGVGQPVPVITTGTIKFYCIYAELSEDGNVEGAI